MRKAVVRKAMPRRITPSTIHVSRLNFIVGQLVVCPKEIKKPDLTEQVLEHRLSQV